MGGLYSHMTPVSLKLVMGYSLGHVPRSKRDNSQCYTRLGLQKMEYK